MCTIYMYLHNCVYAYVYIVLQIHILMYNKNHTQYCMLHCNMCICMYTSMHEYVHTHNILATNLKEKGLIVTREQTLTFVVSTCK